MRFLAIFMTLVLLTLQLCGVVSLPWYVIIAPVLMLAALKILIVVIVAIMATVAAFVTAIKINKD